MLALAALVVLVGVAAMLVIAGNTLDQRLDDSVSEVQKDLDVSLGKLRTDVRKELDSRLPPGGISPVPSAEPTPTEVPPEDDSQTPTPTPSAGTPTPDPAAAGTATPPSGEIRP